jgi:hypothetical protein
VPVDAVVAVAADHQGFAAAFSHELRPEGLWLAGPVEIGKGADVVNLNVVRPLTELAASRLEPSDQLFVGMQRPGRDTVGEHRRLVSLEWNTAEPGDQWVLARGAGFEARS